jgi:hypothetical protein
MQFLVEYPKVVVASLGPYVVLFRACSEYIMLKMLCRFFRVFEAGWCEKWMIIIGRAEKYHHPWSGQKFLASGRDWWWHAKKRTVRKIFEKRAWALWSQQRWLGQTARSFATWPSSLLTTASASAHPTPALAVDAQGGITL